MRFEDLRGFWYCIAVVESFHEIFVGMREGWRDYWGFTLTPTHFGPSERYTLPTKDKSTEFVYYFPKLSCLTVIASFLVKTAEYFILG